MTPHMRPPKVAFEMKIVDGSIIPGSELELELSPTPRQGRIELERFEMEGYQRGTGVIDRQVLDDISNLLAGGMTE